MGTGVGVGRRVSVGGTTVISVVGSRPDGADGALGRDVAGPIGVAGWVGGGGDGGSEGGGVAVWVAASPAAAVVVAAETKSASGRVAA